MDASAPVTGTPTPAPEPLAAARELGLTEEEYRSIEATLGRVPSTAELGAYSVMWSEHCSYKSSKVHLRELPTEGAHVLVGPGENAGVVDVGGGLAVAFKIESHNHPSYVEPYQGAATGVGGIIRDVLTMGARPVALLDPLRFGDPADPTTRRVVDGVVRGIGGYGNSIGVPTVGGEIAFDPAYAGNPLVNVLCVGVLPADGIQLARAEAPGHVAVLIGQRTGRDGIGGASVLASAEFGAGGIEDVKRPNVQVGDPFAGKVLIETCLELYERRLLSGIQDMGAAGIICSSAEMAAAAGLGMRIDLDRVPLRETDMEAWEILCSESQERMLALVDPDRLTEVLDVCRRWSIDATPIGEVTAGDRVRFSWHGELVVDAPAASLADEGPTYHRPVAEWRGTGAEEEADAGTGPSDLEAAAWRVLTDPGVAPPRWVWEQYDGIVGSSTVQDAGGSAAVLRMGSDASGAVLAGGRGVAVATDGNGRWCALDPEEGARLVLAEAARNVACTGARPVAATNNLNFASPEVPTVMGSFVSTIRGLASAARALGTPITGGNVSFYNQTGAHPIHPTPVVGVLGILDDVTRAVGIGLQEPGDALFLVGAPTRAGLGGSAYQRIVEGRLAGDPPSVDLAAERRLQGFLVGHAGLLRSAHDVSGGGLAATLVEACLAGGVGAAVTAEPDLPGHQWLFSESPTRVLVSVVRGRAEELRAEAERSGVPARQLGVVVAEPVLHVEGMLRLDLDELASRQADALPRALGEPVSPSAV